MLAYYVAAVSFLWESQDWCLFCANSFNDNEKFSSCSTASFPPSSFSSHYFAGPFFPSRAVRQEATRVMDEVSPVREWWQVIVRKWGREVEIMVMKAVIA